MVDQASRQTAVRDSRLQAAAAALFEWEARAFDHLAELEIRVVVTQRLRGEHQQEHERKRHGKAM